MKLTVLTDNCAGDKFLAEHGLSYLIEINGEKILFDTGHSDVFLKNAKKLGLDITNEVQKIVLSHGHWDHSGGLKYIKNKSLVTHPDSFVRRFRKNDLAPIGSYFSKEQILENFKLKESKIPIQITKDLFFLGQIPRNNNFESQTTPFVFENGEDDFIPDDSALAAICKNKLVVITGCSHSGICNICEHAKQATGISEIQTVIGGFHLKRIDEQTTKTVNYFKQNKVMNVFPSHCTSFTVNDFFYESFNGKQIKTGMILEF